MHSQIVRHDLRLWARSDGEPGLEMVDTMEGPRADPAVHGAQRRHHLRRPRLQGLRIRSDPVRDQAPARVVAVIHGRRHGRGTGVLQRLVGAAVQQSEPLDEVRFARAAIGTQARVLGLLEGGGVVNVVEGEPGGGEGVGGGVAGAVQEGFQVVEAEGYVFVVVPVYQSFSS